MRKDVSFQSAGLNCRAWFYPGEGAGPRPTVIMSHGITAVKEQHLESYAERFSAEGFSVLVFDYRYLGASDGEPRGRVVPHLQHEDIRAALTYVSRLPEVDARHVALWGSSFSGGHALFVGALDPRVIDNRVDAGEFGGDQRDLISGVWLVGGDGVACAAERRHFGIERRA